VPTIWLPLITALVVLLVALSTLERPIKGLVRTRWPSFSYDGPSVLTWGVATLGTLTMVLLLLLALARP
jgi:hypothetical protein